MRRGGHRTSRFGRVRPRGLVRVVRIVRRRAPTVVLAPSGVRVVRRTFGSGRVGTGDVAAALHHAVRHRHLPTRVYVGNHPASGVTGRGWSGSWPPVAHARVCPAFRHLVDRFDHGGLPQGEPPRVGTSSFSREALPVLHLPALDERLDVLQRRLSTQRALVVVREQPDRVVLQPLRHLLTHVFRLHGLDAVGEVAVLLPLVEHHDVATGALLHLGGRGALLGSFGGRGGLVGGAVVARLQFLLEILDGLRRLGLVRRTGLIGFVGLGLLEIRLDLGTGASRSDLGVARVSTGCQPTDQSHRKEGGQQSLVHGVTSLLRLL